MVSEMLGVGKSRVKLDPEATEHLQDAITRESVRGWLSAGFIWVDPKKGVSRGRVRLRRIKRKQRGLGQGSKKGSWGSRVGKKRIWVDQVRMLRHILKVKRDRGDISKQDHKKLYLQVKGAQIRTRKRLDEEIRRVARR